MNKTEFVQWFDAQVQERWPSWHVNHCIVTDWFEALARYDAATLTEAVRQHKIHGDPSRPKINKVRAIVRARVAATCSCPAASEPTTNVFLECLEAPRWSPHLAGARKGVFVRPLSRQNDPDYVGACAESMRRWFEQIYGGHWITVTTKPSVVDGLRGEPARQKAYKSILNDPDALGKRWLQRIQSGRAEPAETLAPRPPP